MKIKSVLSSLKVKSSQLDFVALALIFLALVSLFFAYLSLKKSDEIVKNLSTQYIGEFPDFLPRMTNELESARKSIYIAKDFPGYGIYSNHRAYLKYRNVLQQKREDNIEIKMIVLNEERRGELHDLQFLHVGFEQLKISDNFQNFLGWSGRDPESINNKEEFKTALTEEQKGTLERDLRGIDIKQIDERIPVYLWIVDDMCAMLSFPSLAGGAVEGAFFTKDGKLITRLKNIFDNLYFQAEQGSE